MSSVYVILSFVGEDQRADALCGHVFRIPSCMEIFLCGANIGRHSTHGLKRPLDRLIRKGYSCNVVAMLLSGL